MAKQLIFLEHQVLIWFTFGEWRTVSMIPGSIFQPMN